MAAALTALLLIVMAQVPASAAPEGDVRGAGSPSAINGSYIVVLKDTATDVPNRARDLAGEHRGKLRHVYRTALRGFSVENMSQKQARRLAAHPDVAYVQQDTLMSLDEATQPNPPSYGLDRIDQRKPPLDNAYTFDNGAPGVTAYVIDSGIRISHADFTGRASYGWDFFDNDANADDCRGHGTHVAGTLGGISHGVAKTVRLVALRVVGCGSLNTTATLLIRAVDYVTENGVKPAVVNMSISGPLNSALEDSIRDSIDKGITYVLSVGDDSIDACESTLAGINPVITVGATDFNDARADFSNYGSCLDIFAPGVLIRSAFYTGDTDTADLTGVSMAVPHVAGAAAMLLERNPSATPAQIARQLRDDATFGVVHSAGVDTPNRLLFITQDKLSRTVPDLTFFNLPDARDRLAETGLAVGEKRFALDHTCNNIGTVMRQRPAEGTTVSAGAAVDLTFGDKPPPPFVCP